MPFSKKDRDATADASVAADDEEISGLLDDPETRAFVDAYSGIKDPQRRAFVEWFVFALSEMKR